MKPAMKAMKSMKAMKAIVKAKPAVNTKNKNNTTKKKKNCTKRTTSSTTELKFDDLKLPAGTIIRPGDPMWNLVENLPGLR